MTQPAAEQLLNLANRAEKGLTPDEAQRLRSGLAHHCERAEEAERRLTNLRSSYKTVLGMFSNAAERAIDNGKRAVRAEAAIERVRAVHQPAKDWSWKPFGCNHIGEHKAPCATCRTCWPCPTIDALDEHQEQPPTLAAHTGGNAEYCPACTGTNPPYPFLCPGPKEN